MMLYCLCCWWWWWRLCRQHDDNCRIISCWNSGFNQPHMSVPVHQVSPGLQCLHCTVWRRRKRGICCASSVCPTFSSTNGTAQYILWPPSSSAALTANYVLLLMFRSFFSFFFFFFFFAFFCCLVSEVAPSVVFKRCHMFEGQTFWGRIPWSKKGKEAYSC